MEWTVERIKTELDRLSLSKDDIFDIPVTINGRLSKVLAKVSHLPKDGKYYPAKMDFSKRILECTDENILKVIAHEWSHYWITKCTGVLCGHDEIFEKVAIEMGGFPSAFISIPEIPQNRYKYNVYCDKCKKLIMRYKRKGKFLKMMDNGSDLKSLCCDNSCYYTTEF